MSSAKNIVANWSNIVLGILSVFITYPILTNRLGVEQYGIWLYISSVTGYFALLQLGVPLANVKFVARFNAANQPDKVNEVLSSNLIFYSVLALLVSGAGFLFSLFMQDFFKMPPGYAETARMAMFLASLNVSLCFMLEMFQGVLHALSDFVSLNAVKNVFIVLRLAMIYFLVMNDNGIVTLAIIMIAITVVQGLTMCLLAKVRFRPMKLSLRSFNLGLFKEITKFSIFVMLLQLAGMLSFQTSAIVIGSFISVSMIVFYNVANNIMVYLMQFIVGISQVILPKVSAYEATGNQEGIRQVYFSYSRLIFICVAPVCVFLVLCGGDFIAVWMGERFRETSASILSILTLSYLFFLVQRGAAFPVFMGTSRMRFLSLLMLVTAAANVLLSIWWGSWYGIVGVAWGTTVPNLITVAGIIWHMKRVHKINLGEYLLKTFMAPAGPVVLFAGAMLAARMVLPVSTYIGLFAIFAVSACVYAGALRLVCFREGFKRGFKSI